MHKGIILLIKAENEEITKTRTDEFLKEYENDVWDWYSIGERWSGTLNKNCKKFYELIKVKGIDVKFISDIEKQETQIELQKIWTEMGETTINPICRDSFLEHTNNVHIQGDATNDDIMKLSDCIEIVKDWSFDYIEKGKKELKEAEERCLQRKNEKTGEIYDDWNMYGYSIKIAGNIFQQRFCFDCNVFNAKKYDYSIPEDIENYYAVMIDIHN